MLPASVDQIHQEFAAINNTIFTNTASSKFWSDFPSAYNSGNAWGVIFFDGSADVVSRSFNSSVRLAPVGQSIVTYSSGDSGTRNAPATQIAWPPTANASGSSTSFTEGTGSVSVMVSEDGPIMLVVRIAGTGGATFTGRMQNGSVSAKWSNPNFGLSGTFTGTRGGD